MEKYQSLRTLAEYIYGINDSNYISFSQADIVLYGMKELGIRAEELPEEGLVPLINGEINKLRLREELILHTK